MHECLMFYDACLVKLLPLSKQHVLLRRSWPPTLADLAVDGMMSLLTKTISLIYLNQNPSKSLWHCRRCALSLPFDVLENVVLSIWFMSQVSCYIIMHYFLLCWMCRSQHKHFSVGLCTWRVLTQMGHTSKQQNDNWSASSHDYFII